MSMTAAGTALAYLRFVRALPNYFSSRITIEQATETVQQRLQQREAHFLDLMEQRIFGNPRSPYLPLLRLAHCELGDLRDMVRQRGLEATLLALREAGVYLTFQEFKGREPVVRHGQVFTVKDRDFDNPFFDAYFQAQTGGSTGIASKVPVSQNHLIASAPAEMLLRDTHGVLDVPMALWLPILPAGAGISTVLMSAYFRRPPERWFSPGTTRERRLSLGYRLATQALIRFVRRLGVTAPQPEWVPLDQAITVARWAAETVRERGACVVRTFVSMALRVALAAQEEGLDLSGATLIGGGEPPTEAKVRGIERSGARWVPLYAMTEVGKVGLACAHPVDGSDVHVLDDAVGLIQYPRVLPGPEITVNALYLTTLLPTATKTMLNVESDDFGILEERRCGCPLEALGYARHLRRIRSFRKLTAEGMTVDGTTLVQVLEEALPARFGGTALDYQLLEEEDEAGFTRLHLVVSPKVRIDDEEALLAMVQDAIRQSGPGESLSESIWHQAQTLRVRRTEPVWSARGKFMPLVRHSTISGSVAAPTKEEPQTDRRS